MSIFNTLNIFDIEACRSMMSLITLARASFWMNNKMNWTTEWVSE